MNKETFFNIKNNIKLFIQGATDFDRKSKALLIKESHNVMDEFLLLCFGDILGIPIPTSYYTLELLPLIADDLDGWHNRISGRLSIWQEKWADYDFDA